MTRTGPITHPRSLVRMCLAAGLVLALGSTAAAQGPKITVEPVADVPGAGATLNVSGTGFSAAGNGIYVVFGPITAAPGYYTDPSIYSAFKWVHSGATESPIEAALAADGSFTTTLDVTGAFTTSAGDVDCAVRACGVITFAAHGSPDRSQDTCVPIAFASSVAASPGSDASSPAEAPSLAPGSSIGPDVSATPLTSDPCEAIGLVAP